MNLLVPAYTRKLGRAEGHLNDLTSLLKVFQDKHPYTVADTVEANNKRVFRLAFTEQPDFSTRLISGDFLYNIRAALDYLAAALVPAADRSHVMFPILYEGVWDFPFVEGESKERTKNRARWEVITRNMSPEAVAILKELQPITGKVLDPYIHELEWLNRLSNRDRHRELVIQAHGLRDVIPSCRMPDGTWMEGNRAYGGRPGERETLLDGATINYPEDTVEVRLTGTPLVSIRVSDAGHIVVPDAFADLLKWIRERVIVPLSPHLHGIS